MGWSVGLWWIVAAAAVAVVVGAEGEVAVGAAAAPPRRHAYAAMMYMGTPRDYEFYVATRVMMRSLGRLSASADRVVIASLDVPPRWVQALKDDGVKVVSVEDLKNPYEKQENFNMRFKLTLNKLYAWSLVSYERVVMLDSDNIFLQNTDELFQCGQFCAVFINPCIFHTGLFVLQPSMDVFKNMLHELAVGRENPDGADQGFLASYFSDLLDQPMFHPPANGTKLEGTYRLPLGYQMDASYYYLKLRWSIPCGPNSVITFPSAPWFKPWYWWSWPVLPLGLSWHEQRRENLGYSSEVPVVLIQAALYIGVIAVTRLARPSLSKLCYNRRMEKKHYVLALPAQSSGSMVYTRSLHHSLLHHPKDCSSAAPMASVPARFILTFFHCDQHIPPPPALRPHDMVRDHRRSLGDVFPMVSKRCRQGLSGVCIRILLCALGLGIVGQDDELVTGPGREGRLQARRT